VTDPQHTFKTFIAFATLRANWNESKHWPTWNDEQREEGYAGWRKPSPAHAGLGRRRL
jgi:hypothetical protein